MEDTHNNTETDGGLLAIDVDTDDYADTATSDLPNVSRTYQSEASFQAEKLSYTAKIHGEPGCNFQELLNAVPALSQILESNDVKTSMLQTKKVILSKKDVHLLGYVVGEMYYDREFQRIVRLCEAVREVCVVDGKVEGYLSKWEGRCKERLQS